MDRTPTPPNEKYGRIAHKNYRVVAQLVAMLAGDTSDADSKSAVDGLTATLGLASDQSADFVLWLTKQQQKRRVLLAILQRLVDGLVSANVPSAAGQFSGWPVVTDAAVCDISFHGVAHDSRCAGI
jgi:hypothetical protein